MKEEEKTHVKFCIDCRSSSCVHTKSVRCFSKREISMLSLLLDPDLCANKVLAHELGITNGTLKVYWPRIYDKLGWSDRSLRRLTLWVVAHAEDLGLRLPGRECFREAPTAMAVKV